MEQLDLPKNIEILAPGGDSDCVKAAIIAGADAVYCGLPVFNARQRAENISIENLKELIQLAHQNGCKIYLTLNTLILEEEFREIFDIVKKVSAMGVDAVIVQDMGLLYFLKRYFPTLEVHASTQMTTHNRGQIEFLSLLNVKQVNCARELSLPELQSLCISGKGRGIKIEAFVHGAYCISFSGQCYMSSAMSGHSGNRGACVQPCRRPYRIGEGRETRLPFNLKDNSAYASAGELIKAGVHSLKIEGRIKNYGYVYTTVTAWRKQVEHFLSTNRAYPDDPSLKTVFNRQFSDGYLKGTIDRNMFIDTSRDQSLVPLGTIAQYHADRKTLTLEKDLDLPAGTQTLIYTEDFKFICTGVIERKTGDKQFLFRIEHELKGKICGGHLLYGLSEQGDKEELKKRIDRLSVVKKPLTISFRGSEGKPLEAKFLTVNRSVCVQTKVVLQMARAQSLTLSVITEKMGMLGTTDFHLEKIDSAELDENLFLPLRELNELRRKGIAALSGEPAQTSVALVVPERKKAVLRNGKPKLACLISSEKELRLDKAEEVEFLYEVPPSLGRSTDAYATLFTTHPSLIPWFSGILIGDDFDAAVALLERIHPPYIVTDNSGIGMEASTRNIPWVAGPLLNCTNSYSIECLSNYTGCKGAFISNELSKEQIRSINLPELPNASTFDLWFTVFNPLLLINTRQCIIRNCNACTKDKTDASCLAECSRRSVVYDTNNNPFYIEKRAGHYNQVYNGRHYFNPDIVRDLRGMFSNWVVDLRDIRTLTTTRVAKEELLKKFVACVRDEPNSVATLRSLIQTTTAGQYTRGV
jgi:U32 family peptidase